MPSSSLRVLVALGVIVSASPLGEPQGLLNVPLVQQEPASRGAENVARQARAALNKWVAGKAVIAPESEDAGFWYGTFTAGATTNLSLLIDTGSADAAVNPGLYKPTSSSKNLHKNGQLRYETTQENGCGTADVSYSEYSDSMSFAGLTAKTQTIANVLSTPPPNNSTITKFPHDGLVGFAGLAESELGATPLFTNLCNQKSVAACRFGLAFGTGGTGEQVLGSVDTSLFTGSMSTAPTGGQQWVVDGDITVGGKVIQQDAQIVLDSGTANIVGPPDEVQAIFDAAGIQAVELSLPGCTKVLTGYYPCAKVPTIGFGFPSQKVARSATGSTSKTSTVFNIEPSAFDEADDGGGNCTAIIAGIDLGVWIVGQAFFQGKYVDHNVDGKSMGFAQLVNKAGR